MTKEPTRLQAADGRWTLAGPLTMDSAAAVLAASKALALPAAGVVDLARVEPVDSAGVAVLLAWKHRAAAEDKLLAFTGAPQGITSLAELYGVEDFLAK